MIMSKIKWPNTLRILMKECGETQESIAEKLHVSQGLIGHYLNDRRMPPIKRMRQFADFFKVEISDLIEKEEGREKTKSLMPISTVISPSPRGLPILEWSEFDHFLKICLNNPFAINSVPHETLPGIILSHDKKNHIALRIQGRAMVSTSDERKSLNLYPGEVIVVALGVMPRDGDLIICKIDGTMQVRLYEKSSPHPLLIILNETYPDRIIRYNPETMEIVGKVIGKWREFD